jgi:hypothetical protein
MAGDLAGIDTTTRYQDRILAYFDPGSGAFSETSELPRTSPDEPIGASRDDGSPAPASGGGSTVLVPSENEEGVEEGE